MTDLNMVGKTADAALQIAFDIMVARLYDGRGRAVGDYGCEYLGTDGIPCVVGVLLPDDHPARNPNYSGFVNELATRYEDETPEVIVENLQFMAEMQAIHDPAENWGTGKYPLEHVWGQLRNLAEIHNLEMPRLPWKIVLHQHGVIQDTVEVMDRDHATEEVPFTHTKAVQRALQVGGWTRTARLPFRLDLTSLDGEPMGTLFAYHPVHAPG